MAPKRNTNKDDDDDSRENEGPQVRSDGKKGQLGPKQTGGLNRAGTSAARNVAEQERSIMPSPDPTIAEMGVDFLKEVKELVEKKNNAQDRSDAASVASTRESCSSYSTCKGGKKHRMSVQSREDLDKIVTGILHGPFPRTQSRTRDKLKQPEEYMKELDNVPRTKMAAVAKRIHNVADRSTNLYEPFIKLIRDAALGIEGVIQKMAESEEGKDEGSMIGTDKLWEENKNLRNEKEEMHREVELEGRKRTRPRSPSYVGPSDPTNAEYQERTQLPVHLPETKTRKGLVTGKDGQRGRGEDMMVVDVDDGEIQSQQLLQQQPLPQREKRKVAEKLPLPKRTNRETNTQSMEKGREDKLNHNPEFSISKGREAQINKILLKMDQMREEVLEIIRRGQNNAVPPQGANTKGKKKGNRKKKNKKGGIDKVPPNPEFPPQRSADLSRDGGGCPKFNLFQSE